MNFRPATYWAEARAQSPVDSAGTVEIARLQFKYGPPNLVRLLARPVQNGIGYQIGKDTAEPYDATPASTVSPLSFAELIDVIEVDILPRAARYFHRSGRSTEQLVDFIDASSGLYPELRAWYEQEAREWAGSRKLFSVVETAVSSAMAVAAVFSVARASTFSASALDLFVFAYFGLSVLSLAWATDRRRCLSQLARWLPLGAVAYLVAQGFSLPYCASFVAGGALLYLIVGLGFDLKTEAYRPLIRYRFAGIGHPNWQAESCLLLLFSAAYLHNIGLIPTAAWVLLLVFTVLLLLLTRSRTGFWVAVATALAWTGLELSYSLPPTGLVMLLLLVGGAATLLSYYLTAHDFARPPDGQGGWKARLSAIVHLGRDRFARRSLGGRAGLWRFVLEAIREKPYLGYGYGVFWAPERAEEVLRRVKWTASSSHSMYLDGLLNAGPAGLGLFLLLLAGASWRALTLPAAEAVFLGAFFFMVAMEGIFESAFLTPNLRSFSFFLLIFSIS